MQQAGGGRLLQRLLVVEQLDDTRRYRLGQELAVLGWSANRTVYDLKELAAEEMTAVAAKTGLLVTIHNAAHLTNLEQPEAFNALLLRFAA